MSAKAIRGRADIPGKFVRRGPGQGLHLHADMSPAGNFWNSMAMLVSGLTQSGDDA